jgi:hypothetical protein
LPASSTNIIITQGNLNGDGPFFVGYGYPDATTNSPWLITSTTLRLGFVMSLTTTSSCITTVSSTTRSDTLKTSTPFPTSS